MSPSTNRRPRAGHAFTLAEVIVFCLLLLLLMGGMYLLLVAGMRTVQQSNSYQTAQQQALIGIRALTGELSNARADASYLIYSPGTPSIVFMSGFQPFPASQEHLIHPNLAEATTLGGSPVIWQKWVGYWLDAQGNLNRAEDVTTGPEVGPCNACVAASVPSCLNITFPPGRLPAGTLLNVPAAPSGLGNGGGNWAHKKTIARFISALDFEPVASQVPMGVIVTLYAQDATASDKFTQVRYRISAWMQN